MTKKPGITVRNVEHGKQFYVDVHKLKNYNINTEKYKKTIHWHDHFEMEILDEGSAIHLINGDVRPLHRHDAFLVTPADVHTILPDTTRNDDLRVDLSHIGFSASAISESVFNELMSLKGPLHASLSEEVYQSFQTIFALIQQDGSATKVRQNEQRSLCDYLMQKFMELHNSQTHVREAEAPDAGGPDDRNDAINRAISYIKYHFRNPKLTTQKVAKAVFLTPNYFGELFYRKMHITCQGYIRKLKLNFAMSLLNRSDVTVAEIAEKSGYANISYFIKEFKTEFGSTPQTYREQRKNEEEPLGNEPAQN